MKKTVLILLLASLTLTFADAQSKNTEPPGLLSIEQSLLPVSDVHYLFSKDFPCNRINPAIKEYLLFYLAKDNSMEGITDRSLRLLGYVADETDLPFIDSFIQAYIRKTNTSNSKAKIAMGFQNFGLGSGCVTAVMLEKNIKGAKDLLNKYSKDSVWLAGCENDKAKEEALRAQDAFLIQVHQYSMDADTLKLLKKRLSEGRPDLAYHVENAEKRKTGVYAESIKPVKIREKTLQKKLNKDVQKYIGYYKPMLNKMTIKQWQSWQKQLNAKPRKGRSNTANKITLTGMTHDLLVLDAIEQARAAYDKVSKMVLDGKFDGIDKLLADNGRAIKPGKIERMKDEFEKELRRIGELLKDVEQAGLNGRRDILVKLTVKDYKDYPGETILEARFDSFPARLSRSAAADRKNVTAASVTFTIPGTAEIFKKHIPRVSDANMRASNGDLKVFMINIDGKWLWNPFGW